MKAANKTRNTHGGRRPGAGAPPGNMNGYKHGARSQQVVAMRQALELVPMTADHLAKVSGREPARLKLLARALHYYADMLLLLSEGRSIKNFDTLQLHGKNMFDHLIKQSSAAAKRDMGLEIDRAPG